jgi:hypothetical protein
MHLSEFLLSVSLCVKEENELSAFGASCHIIRRVRKTAKRGLLASSCPSIRPSFCISA